MSTSRAGAGLAALVLAGLAVLGLHGPASAHPVTCPDPTGVYPPGNCQQDSVTDSTPVPGQTITVATAADSFDPGTSVEYGIQSVYQKLGVTTANEFGAAIVNVTIPRTMKPGRHAILFTGVKDGRPTRVSVPITVVAGPAGNRGIGTAGAGTDAGTGSGGTGPGGTGTGPGGTGTEPGGSGPDGAGTEPGRKGLVLPYTAPRPVTALVLSGLGLLAVVGVVAVVLHRRRQQPDGIAA